MAGGPHARRRPRPFPPLGQHLLRLGDLVILHCQLEAERWRTYHRNVRIIPRGGGGCQKSGQGDEEEETTHAQGLGSYA